MSHERFSHKAPYRASLFYPECALALKEHPRIELRGALGQFVILFPEQELIVVATAHGTMSMLKDIPLRIVPAFAE